MTPKELLARVFGVFNTGTMAFAMIGITAVRWAVDQFDPVISLISVGAIKLGTAVCDRSADSVVHAPVLKGCFCKSSMMRRDGLPVWGQGYTEDNMFFAGQFILHEIH